MTTTRQPASGPTGEAAPVSGSANFRHTASTIASGSAYGPTPLARSQRAFDRPHDQGRAAAQRLDLGADLRFAPHRVVHCRRHHHRALEHQSGGAQEVVRETERQAGQRVGGRRRDAEQIGPLRRLDMEFGAVTPPSRDR